MNKPILIYSKHCNNCSSLFKGLNLPWDNLFHLLSFDNKTIRNSITNSKKIKIFKLPCILVVDNKNKSIYKYEGNIALEWIKKSLLQQEEPMKNNKEKKSNIEESVESVENGISSYIPHGIVKGQGHEEMKGKTSINEVREDNKKSNIVMIDDDYMPEEVRDKKNNFATVKMENTKNLASKMMEERNTFIEEKKG
jgi:glutaredoxin-related protein